MAAILLPLITLAVLRAIKGSLEGIDTELKDAFAAVERPQGKPKLLWANHIPALAVAFANMMDLDTALFSWLKFKAADLRNLNDTVEVLREIKAFLDSLSDQVGGLLGMYRDQLYTLVTDAVDDLQKVKDCPTTDPDVQKKLDQIARGVLSIVTERNTKIKGRREANKKTDAQHHGQVAQLQQQIDVLRGGPMPGLPAGKKTRRSRKKA